MDSAFRRAYADAGIMPMSEYVQDASSHLPLDVIAAGCQQQKREELERLRDDVRQLREAMKSLIRMLEAVRYTAGLGPQQIERINAAKALLERQP